MRNIFLSLLLVLVSAGGASAQEAPAPAPAPAADIPAVAASNTAVATKQGYFPTLPPSRQCELKNVWGIWKLASVYESPEGANLAVFRNEPHQYAYLYSKQNNLYKEFRNASRPLSNEELRNNLTVPQTPVQQYSFNQGFLYFYKDGSYASTMACFIVATSTEEFKAGQMLLMPPAPPEGQPITSRMVKVYTKVNLPPPPRKPAPKRKR